MKSLTKSGPRAIADSQFQISLPMQGVLRDVQHSFVGLCAYFSPSWTAFQTDRGRCFSVIVDDRGARK